MSDEGMAMTTSASLPYVELTRAPLDRAALEARVLHAGAGAVVTFEGVVRDQARGHAVVALEYEAYEEMAANQLHAIAQDAATRWGTQAIAVAHRFGRMAVGETSVIIVVATPHRADAFDACRAIIDAIKTTVPIWKKEFGPDGAEWVEG
jgi:molybdopterin synthase catalytic subunit